VVDQIAAMRALTIRKAIQTWVKHGIKVNRLYTPSNMARTASGITGKSYSSSKKSLAQAADDIAAMYPEACK
jgi:hypothetical protein